MRAGPHHGGQAPAPGVGEAGALSWYAARLRTMTPAEAVHRVGRAVRQQFRRLSSGARNGCAADPVAAAAAIRPRSLSFFDIELSYPSAERLDWWRDYRSGRRAPGAFYGDLDYRDVEQVGDSKYVWELNRHQFLASWGLEYARTQDEAIPAAIAVLITDWIAANPRYYGINWVSPLEAALRILSWGISLDLCRDSPHVLRNRQRIAVSVAEQAAFVRRTLSLHSSANNHLVGELIGLLAAGAFFPEARGARAGAAFAWKRIRSEAERQVLPDGVNREQAVYYHHYTLEYLLTAAALAEKLGEQPDAQLAESALHQLAFVDAMTDDAGACFEVGDRDDGTVTGLNLGSGAGVFESLLWTGWVLFGDEACGGHAARIARARGGEPAPDPRNRYWYPEACLRRGAPPDRARTRSFFPEGGYFVSRDGGFALMVKSGPFGYPSIAAHAHCDQLGVQLKRGDLTILGDGGTYVYHTEPRWRRYFRGTSAHNTVRVDGRDQAEYGGPFLWTTHADGLLELVRDEEAAFTVNGEHRGYKRLPDPVRHRRSVRFRAGRGYRIEDHLCGTAPHVYELFWNLGADVDLEPGSDGPRAWWVTRGGRPLVAIVLRADAPLEVRAVRGDEAGPAGFESRRYLEKRPAWQILASVNAANVHFETCVIPVESRSPSALTGAFDGWS